MNQFAKTQLFVFEIEVRGKLQMFASVLSSSQKLAFEGCGKIKHSSVVLILEEAMNHPVLLCFNISHTQWTVSFVPS